jgi:hypothetical protein
MNSKPIIKVDRTGVIIWTLLGCLFVYAGVAKYGLLLAYLNASGYLSLFLAGFITHMVNQKLVAKVLAYPTNRHATWQRLRFVKTALICAVFFALIYLFFFIQPDKLAIAKLMRIPIEALYPCSNLPLDPETERTAREIFRLKQIDKFDGDYCNQ